MRSRLVYTLVVALAVVGLLEGCVRVLADRIPEPLDWYHVQAQELVGEMNLLQSAGMTSDLVFVGTSMTRADVQVPIIEDELGTVGRAHNAGIPAAQTTVVRTWLIDEIEPRIHPERVVWGVSSLDFNGNRREPTIEAYLDARATEPGLVAELDRVVGWMSALSHNRQQLRDPAVLTHLLEPPPAEPDVPLEDLMSPLNTLDRVQAGRRAERHMRTQVLNDYAIGEREVAAFRETVGWMKARGIEVVVILMPVPQRYVAAHPDGEEDLEEFRTWITAEAEDLGIPLFDYSRTVEDEGFKDLSHLRPDWAIEFTHTLAADLRSLGW